ncbi:MAG: ABC transporter ATP-binding protein [Chitinophagales bacterium]|nr:ABC transporter ATP-binding protein [Chitinophagales bacterium]
MTVKLVDVWKNYDREFILRQVNYEFVSGESYAILGPNGSGKSTLLQLVAGLVSPNRGNIEYIGKQGSIPVESLYKHLGFSSPYMQLMEDFTLKEQLVFHKGFRHYINKMEVNDVLMLMALEKEANKLISNFSSGMKQRVKLALSVLTESELLLLDEPATNLDTAGITWYQALLKDYRQDRTLIVSSNRLEEYEMCEHRIDIAAWK